MAYPSPLTLPVHDLLFGDLPAELAYTRRLLNRIPDEHFDFRPHPGSRTLGELANHIAELPHWSIATLRRDELDLDTWHRHPVRVTSREALLHRWDEAVADMTFQLAEADGDALHQPCTVRQGARAWRPRPRALVLRRTVLNHLLHHRGQLSVYLRLTEMPLPGAAATADSCGIYHRPEAIADWVM